MADLDPAMNGAAKAQSEPVALFVSDVHLQPSMPHTTEAFLDFLRHQAIRARQLYLLGDLFEAWAGDDDIAAPYNRRIVEALRALHEAGVALFWIGGNRDFLIGPAFAAAVGATLLDDPAVVTIAGRTLALAHGDAQCTDDVDYMAFREKVRQDSWQREFLELPLAQRKSIIEGLRNGSREAQRGKSYEIMDVNPAAVAALFDATGTSLLIHGHTHRPGCHEYPSTRGLRLRHVLPDWDCDTEPPRGGWLVLHADGSLRRVGLDGNEIPAN